MCTVALGRQEAVVRLGKEAYDCNVHNSLRQKLLQKCQQRRED